MLTEETLTASELEQGRAYLEQTRKGITGAIKRLNEAQWRFKPAAECWSIAEIVDHVIFVMEFVLGPVRGQLAAAPAAPAEYDCRVVDAMVIGQFPNRLSKFPAPELARPSGRFDAAGGLDRLTQDYAGLREFLEGDLDLRAHAVAAPPLKAISKGVYEAMDGYQWILAAAAHTERHTKQILEVMAEAGFPG